MTSPCITVTKLPTARSLTGAASPMTNSARSALRPLRTQAGRCWSDCKLKMSDRGVSRSAKVSARSGTRLNLSGKPLEFCFGS